MFEQKKKFLFKKRETSVQSRFADEAMKTTSVVSSGNGAKKYSTTGNEFVDQFGKLGSYKAPRSFNDIAMDCERLWASNVRLTVIFIFYIRMITRVVNLFNGISTKVSQKGAELKHEGIMRMLWLSFKDERIFSKNLHLFISIGSWKDIFTMLEYDLVHHGWGNRVLNWTYIGDFILSGLNNETQVNLVKKYLPQIKADSKCTTVEAQAHNMTAKWICSLLYGSKESSYNYKKYRKMKSSGTAHEWQQLISQGKHNLIDFSKIHGRALSLLVRGKYLFNQGLSDKYAKWAAKPSTEIKYTGFVHELFKDYGIQKLFNRNYNNYTLKFPLVNVAKHIQDTINKQFYTLVNKGRSKDHKTNFIVVRDTSGSMSALASGTTMSCYDIGKALALYFSEFLVGRFSNNFIEFNSTAIMKAWKGNTPMEKWFNDNSGFYGSTNFQSVISLFCKLRNTIPEEEFPTGILCISDSEFNPSSLNKNNVEDAKSKLRTAGFSRHFVDNFVIVLWNLQSSFYGPKTGQKFETYGNVPNVFYFSGYSPATISFLTDDVKTADDLFNAAMDQEVLNMIEI